MVAVSVVIPAKNEQDNIEELVREIHTALEKRFEYEIIYINDGSTDNTLMVIQDLQTTYPGLKVWSHSQSAGQSRAVFHGVHLSENPIIATLDADGQNDPADIPAMIDILVQSHETPNQEELKEHIGSLFQKAGGTVMVAGHRKKRHDSWLKRVSSKLANGFRSRILKDKTPDTGCGLKVFYRDTFLRLPYFDHMHRYLPALVQRFGYHVTNYEVHHRPRHAGTSKYGFHNRLWVGIVDIFGVMWLQRRCKPTQLLHPTSKEKMS